MLKKQYVKTRDICKVTFEVPREQLPHGVDDVDTIEVAGDFNNWQPDALTYRKTKDAWNTIIELAPGERYRFRYLANGNTWFNDWEADSYEPGEAGEDNCVVAASSGE